MVFQTLLISLFVICFAGRPLLKNVLSPAALAILIPLTGSLLLFSTVTAHSRNNSTPHLTFRSDSDTSKAVTVAEKLPQFPGGELALSRFIARTVRYPVAMRKHTVQGIVFISFVIEKDGSLSNFKILRDVGDGGGTEAIRVLRLSPKWEPGTVEGKPVRVLYTLPFKFVLN